ncbi:S-adenosyl-L-methionine-dependent methyltransferase [Schizophyllum commune H4-8]|nr:S-adenosyl-L-methionine-dependent methyltransferase [Schizophyllum commune H4-8]KAI5886254.1 S-adenosyl-L-methionine-dependent methyltransferase [Schizophyllum commune H4-8]
MREVRDGISETQLRELRNKKRDFEKMYGEFEPHFFQTILEEQKLGPQSTFVDLGCGIGNLLVQAAIQSGCSAFGIELRDELMGTAESLKDRALAVCELHGISMGSVTMAWGDMVKTPAVKEWMKKADLVVVNNLKFSATLNLQILDSFLPLMKHGACVIATDLFISGKQTRHGQYKVYPDERTLEVTEQKYPERSISWTNSSAPYYIHRVHDPAIARRRQEQLGKVYTGSDLGSHAA